jgi:hypothetical protein
MKNLTNGATMTDTVHIKGNLGTPNPLFENLCLMLGDHESDLRRVRSWQQEFEAKYAEHRRYVNASFWRNLCQKAHNWWHENEFCEFFSTPEYDCQFECERIIIDRQCQQLTSKIDLLTTIINAVYAGNDVVIHIKTLNHLLERNPTKWES